ncbi:MAG: hypothetical protein D6731_03430 [Planctomycetota bacterium]|nr:MAG: hypothetical protein D6731_03430 [Planctomycetota bacterium]
MRLASRKVERQTEGVNAPTEGSPRNGGSHNPSTRLLRRFAEAAVPLPESVERSRVKAIRRDQLEDLVRTVIESEEAGLRERIAQLEAELEEALRSRSLTARHELPRLARLVEEERERAELLEGELELLEERIEELESEAAARERELEELRASEGEGGGRSGAVELALEALSRCEERTARLSALEDMVWELEGGSDPDRARQRAFAELREQLDQQQRSRRELEARAQELRRERDRLLLRVRELEDAVAQGRLEVETLSVRYASLEGALASARAEAEAGAAEAGAAERTPDADTAVYPVPVPAVSDRPSGRLGAEGLESSDEAVPLPLGPDGAGGGGGGMRRTQLLEHPLAGEAEAIVANLRAQLEAMTRERDEALSALVAAREASESIREALECELTAVGGALDEARALLAERERERDELRAELAAATEELEARLEDVDHLDSELDAARRAYRDLSSAADALEAELLLRRRALAESRLAEAALAERLDSLEGALERRLAAAEQVFADLSEQRERSEDSAREREAELAELRAELAELRASSDSEALRSEARLREEAEARARAASQRADALEGRLAALLGSIEGAKVAAGLARREALAARRERDALRVELESARATTRLLERELQEARERAATPASAAEPAEELAAARERIERLEADLAAARAAGEAQRAEAARLSAELDELRSAAPTGQEAPADGSGRAEELERERARREELEEELDWLRTTQQRALSLRQEWERQLEETHARNEELGEELEAALERVRELSTALEEAEARVQRAEAVAAQAAVDVVDQATLAENERLRQELRDLERAHESECWRGLATHRDLVLAQQRVRDLERLLAELRSSGPAQADAETRADAARWLVESTVLDAEFAEEALEVLVDLEERIRALRREARRSRADFDAERRPLHEERSAAERALQTAQAAGVPSDGLDRKSRLATRRLQRLDEVMEASLLTQQERLARLEDLRVWLLEAVGRAPRDGELADELEEVREDMDALSRRVVEERALRRKVEADALRALQSMESERAALEVELTRERARCEHQALLVRRLERRLRERAVLADGSVAGGSFSEQAEALAVLQRLMDDRESSLHWLLQELDPQRRAERARAAGELLEELEQQQPAVDEDMRRWLACELGPSNGHSRG